MMGGAGGMGGMDPAMMQAFMNSQGGAGGASGFGGMPQMNMPTADNRPPAEKYATEL
jgi:hypothetical protein